LQLSRRYRDLTDIIVNLYKLMCSQSQASA
jgi:hypothetical protein